MTLTMTSPLITPNLLQLTRNSSDISLSKLAKETGLSKSTIIRAEQGLLVSIPPALTKYFKLNFDLAEQNYKRFQLDTRYYGGGVASESPFFSDGCDLISLRNYGKTLNELKLHPLNYLLDQRSVLEFCQAFCLPPNLINRWVSRSTTVRTVPTIVRTSLVEAGHTDQEVNYLKLAYRTHLSYLLRTRNVVRSIHE